jgi:hypothetical protein
MTRDGFVEPRLRVLEGNANMTADQKKHFVDNTTRIVHEGLEKGAAAVEESARGIEQGYFAAAGSIRDFNVRLIEMAHANTLAMMDFARDVSTATGPAEAVALCSSHAQKRLQAMTEQTKELQALGLKITTSSTQPITRGFSQALQHRS